MSQLLLFYDNGIISSNHSSSQHFESSQACASMASLYHQYVPIRLWSMLQWCKQIAWLKLGDFAGYVNIIMLYLDGIWWLGWKKAWERLLLLRVVNGVLITWQPKYTSWLVDLNVISPLTLYISPCEFLEPVDSIKRKRNWCFSRNTTRVSQLFTEMWPLLTYNWQQNSWHSGHFYPYEAYVLSFEWGRGVLSII